jgi:hypothetical protein
MPKNGTTAAVALAVLLLLAGCGGAANAGAGGDGGGGYAFDSGASSGGRGVEDAAAGESSGSSVDAGAVLQQRALVKTGRVVVEIDDFRESRANLTAAVEEYGGFVSETHVQRRGPENHSYVYGTLVFRVPADRYDELLADAEAEGEVIVSETDVDDVTDRLVDLEARLENLRAERDRLRELYERANTTEEVLAVQRELSDVQGEIERLEAQQRSLERRVAYSTLAVELREPDPTPRYVPERWYDTPVLTAFLDSVSGVVVVGRAMVVAVAYALPYLLAFGAPVALLGAAVWRLRHRFPR